MPEEIAAQGGLLGVAVFLVLAGLESICPALPLTGQLGLRWVSNLGVHTLNLGLAVGLGLLGLGLSAVSDAGTTLGLFAAVTGNLPFWLQLFCALLVLDLFSYLTHRLQHRIGWLWPFHAVHHADPDLDATTGFRHHPGEFLLMQAFSLALGLLLGIPLQFWAFYAMLASALALIQHANLRLPETVVRALRSVLVTPGMHRHHHAMARAIHDTNYGMVLSVWDRAFRTYRTDDPAVRDALPIGLAGLVTQADQRLDGVLRMPLRLFSRNSP